MAGNKKTKIEKKASKVVKQAVSKVKPKKKMGSVEKMGLISGKDVKGANLLQANRNPTEAEKEYKRLNPPVKKASKKKK